MPQFQIKRQEQIQDDIANRTIARTDLTDLTDSSVIKHFIVGTARQIDGVYYQLGRLRADFDLSQAAGDDLDDRAREIQPGKIRRVQPRRSIGLVVFSRATNTLTTITIPAGTVVKTTSGQTFRTTQQAQISATSTEQITGHGVGRDSDLTSAVAEQSGEAGNVATNTVIKFASRPPGVSEVTNPTAFIQGRDKESDDSFRQRIQDFIASLATGTVDALEFGAIGVEDTASGKQVVFSHVFQDPLDRGNVTIYVDDGAGTAETTALVGFPTKENVTAGLTGPPVNSAVGGEEFLSLDFKPVKLEALITITSERPINTPFRGDLTLGTHYFINPADAKLYFTPPLEPGEVIRAEYTRFTGLIEQVQKVMDGDRADRQNFPGIVAAGVLARVLAPVVISQDVCGVVAIQEGFDYNTVIAAIDTAVSRYINNLGISGDVITAELIERVMGVEGVIDFTIEIPETNRAILDNEIPRIVSDDIDIT